MLRWLARRLQRRRFLRICRERIAMRIPQIRRDLAAAPPGFAWIVGDSHAEFLCAHPLGSRPVVNAGIGGISTGGYAERLPQLLPVRRAGVAVLVTGSNDLSVRGRPLSPEAIARFEAAATSLVRGLRDHADRVVVLALPPMDPVPGQEREPAAVEDYSTRLARIAPSTAAPSPTHFPICARGGEGSPGGGAERRRPPRRLRRGGAEVAELLGDGRLKFPSPSTPIFRATHHG